MSKRSNISPSQVAGIIVMAPICYVIYWFIVNPGLFSKLQVIVTHNICFWFTCFAGIIYAGWCKYKNPKEISWLEVPIQIFVTMLALFMFYNIFYYAATDLKDKEVWNSRIAKAEYWEEWTEEVCTTDDDGNETCSDIYHPPEWDVITQAGEKIDITKKVYRNYVGHFDNEKKDSLFHSNQVSFGDGDMFYSTFNGPAELEVPSANEHRFVNYVKESSETLHRRGSSNTTGFDKLLVKYPRVYAGPFGKIELDRVVTAGIKVPGPWTKAVDHKLDKALISLGSAKQANILVYLAGTSDQSFLHALEAHWINGKKNDIIVIIGSSSYPKIDWVSVMAWTTVEEFKVELRDKIMKLKTLEGNEEKLVSLITGQVAKSPEQGGFKRQPMAELSYLAGDVRLPFWAQLLVILISAFSAWLCGWALKNNTIKS